MAESVLDIDTAVFRAEDTAAGGRGCVVLDLAASDVGAGIVLNSAAIARTLVIYTNCDAFYGTASDINNCIAAVGCVIINSSICYNSVLI